MRILVFVVAILGAISFAHAQNALSPSATPAPAATYQEAEPNEDLDLTDDADFDDIEGLIIAGTFADFSQQEDLGEFDELVFADDEDADLEWEDEPLFEEETEISEEDDIEIE